ncbi:MAG: hypothetical protein IKI30_08000 [Oxalobacter sp.]|nr:hypothetical protein [Oxalobacter sp.]
MTRKPANGNIRQLMAEGEKVSQNIVLCADGKYRWTYEMSLYRNPAIFLLVWKIFFFIFSAIFACILIADIIDWGTKNIIGFLKFFFYFLIGMTVVIGLGYLIYAVIMGGKYSMLFEMDEDGINHKQMPNQAKKAKAVSSLTVLAGLFSGKVTTVGVGINAARSEMYSDFSKVQKVIADPDTNLIKVNELLSHNQIYTETEDFDFVLKYITSHCPNLK